MPVDWQPDADTQTLEGTLEFNIRVNPCLVTSYDVTSDPIEAINYTLGDSEIIFGPYNFA